MTQSAGAGVAHRDGRPMVGFGSIPRRSLDLIRRCQFPARAYTRRTFCRNAIGDDPCVADHIRCVIERPALAESVPLVESQSGMRSLGEPKRPVSHLVSDQIYPGPVVARRF
jgi:hypothetical protein